MGERQRYYIAIDLKSFYASVECVERGLNPLTTNLVVADVSRTEKTICLAVSPSLKMYGIPGRARLFEVVQRVKEVNSQRLYRLKDRGVKEFTGKSTQSIELEKDDALQLDYIAAPPQMAKYMQYSTRIYNIYLKYIAPEDMHVYSIDEVFMDVTEYLSTYKLTPKELAMKIIKDVLDNTGITATAGIGTNMYLCKIAMDIVAKHIPADENGVRIAELDEMSYRQQLWEHRPLTDFWRVGRGYATKLESKGLYTMGDVARCSIGGDNDFYNEDLLYDMFGVNAELLIDHAWGWEPCTIAQVRAYRPQSNSLSSGQVLHCPYDYEKAALVVREMTDALSLDLVEKGLVTDQIVLTIGYDIENLTNEHILNNYKGEIKSDHYGRKIPKHAHGTVNLERNTASTRMLTEAVMNLYSEIVDRQLLIRRITVVANHIESEKNVSTSNISKFTQLSLFSNYEEDEEKLRLQDEELEKEKKMQKAMLTVKKKFGKNAMVKGMNLLEGGTAIQRNSQIGGHKA